MLFLQIFSIGKTCPVFHFLSNSPVLSWLLLSPFLLWVFLLKFPTKLNAYLQVLQNQWRIQCALYSVCYTSVKFITEERHFFFFFLRPSLFNHWKEVKTCIHVHKLFKLCLPIKVKYFLEVLTDYYVPGN